MNKSFATRLKAAAVSLTMAAAVLPAYPATVNAVSTSGVIPFSANKGVSQTMKVDSVYEGTIPEEGAKSVTFTLSTSYTGQSFSYGFGCSTTDSPY